jgi:aldose 1-epimerase
MLSPEAVVLSAGSLEARLKPEIGGRMTHLRHRDLGEILVPTPDAAFEPLNWPKAGAYPLFPYHNRVKGAAFEHDGKHVALVPHPALATDTIHGPAHRRPWKVENASKDAANLVLDYAADEDWPFVFRAGQGFRLFPDRLEITLTLINTGNSPMPGGLGWHPYFATSRMSRVETDACLRWPTDEIGLPIGGAEARRATRLAASDFTEHFSAWSEASAEVDAGGTISLSADAGLPHLVAHRTPCYLCLEPVSHVAGALRLPQRSWSDRGLAILRSTERMQGKIVLRVNRAALQG